MRTKLASERRPVCVKHPNRDAVALRLTTVGKGAKLPPQSIRARVCEECAGAKVKQQTGIEVRVVPMR